MNDKSNSTGRKQHHDLLHWDLFPKVPFKPKSIVFHCFPFPAMMLGMSCPALAAPFGSSGNLPCIPASNPGQHQLLPLALFWNLQWWCSLGSPLSLGWLLVPARALEGLLCHHILSDTALLPCTAEQMETCCPSVSCSCTIPPTSFILVLNPSEWGSFNEF